MRIHHIALIVSSLDRSLSFYQDILEFKILHKLYREERKSWKVDLVREGIGLELFTFPDAPVRPSYPEAIGLRHIALAVQDLEGFHRDLRRKGILVEEIRVDHLTGKKFFFFADPDDLPWEIYEN